MFDTSEFIIGPDGGCAKLSLLLVVTLEQTSANAWRWLEFVPGVDVAGTVVVVVDVRLMHVFTEGIRIGIGIVGATHGCGLAITPQAAFFLLNSTSHSFIAFFKACRGWYIFGDNVDGTSSPRTPSSVSVSNLISADTVSSTIAQ